MNKFVFLLLFVFSCVLHANQNVKVQITGAKGKVLTNVKKRLDELQQLKQLNELTADELRVQVIKAVQPYGYFKAEAQIRIHSQQIQIEIYKGPKVLINTVHIKLLGEGAQNPILKATVSGLPLHHGAPFISSEYTQAKRDLAAKAEQLGYLHGQYKQAQVLIDEAQNLADISLEFDTGPMFYFGQVEFSPTYIRPELLHRFVPFRPGQPYSSEQILKLNNDLSGSGYFNSVVINPQISSSTQVPVNIQLTPAPKYSYSLGVGYGTDTGVRGRAAMHITPLNRSGHKFNAIAQGSFLQNTLQAQYIIPGSNPAVDQYSLTGNFSNLNYDTGYSNATLVSLAQQHNLDWYQRTLSLNGLYESFHYTDEPNTNQVVFYPKGTFSFTQAKNKLFSPSGYNLTINGLGASRHLMSKLNFVQTSLDAKAALTIDPLRLRLYGHALYGVTQTPDINQLPLSLALLLGGTDNLKGYSFNSIGPGKTTLYGGFEIQKETFKNWYLVGFYDAGTVYQPDPKIVQYDVGGGIMWTSPIGPIKIGLAQPTNNRFQPIEGSGPRLFIRMGPDL